MTCEPQSGDSVAGGRPSDLSGYAPAAASGAAAPGSAVLPPAELADASATTVAHDRELFPVPEWKYADAPAAPKLREKRRVSFEPEHYVGGPQENLLVRVPRCLGQYTYKASARTRSYSAPEGLQVATWTSRRKSGSVQCVLT